MVDKVGDYFMHMCFWRYTQLMDHPDVTYEQYLELVAKGEGKVEVPTYDEDKPDQEESEMNTIDPRKGFSYVLVDEALPMVNGYYYLGSSKEKILSVFRESVFDISLCEGRIYSKTACVNVYSGSGLINSLSRIGATRWEHDRSSTPSKFLEWQHLYLEKEMDKYLDGSRSGPPFSLLQP
jgi:hypothetical protein